MIVIHVQAQAHAQFVPMAIFSQEANVPKTAL